MILWYAVIWFQALWECLLLQVSFQVTSETILRCCQNQAEKPFEVSFCLIHPENSCTDGFIEFSDRWSAHCFCVLLPSGPTQPLEMLDSVFFSRSEPVPGPLKWVQCLEQWPYTCSECVSQYFSLLGSPYWRSGMCQYLCKCHAVCYVFGSKTKGKKCFTVWTR